MPGPAALLDMPAEAIWRIFMATNSPKLVFKVLPFVCRRFQAIVASRKVPMFVNVDINCDEWDDECLPSSLIHPPEAIRTLPNFQVIRLPPRPTRSPLTGVLQLPRSPPDDAADVDGDVARQLQGQHANSTTAMHGQSAVGFSGLVSPLQSASSSSSSLSTGSAAIPPNTSNGLYHHQPRLRVQTTTPLRPTSIDTNLLAVGLERTIRINARALTEHPERLIMYLDDLLRRCPKGRVLPLRVIHGSVQIQGRCGRSVDREALASFVGLLQAQALLLWSWDTDLVRAIALLARPRSIKIPNMKTDGHISVRDFAAIGDIKSLVRIEFFRPFPREPWGIEASAFATLVSLPNLKEVIFSSGRLVQRVDIFKNAILALTHLQVLELNMMIDIVYASRILQRLKHLKSFHIVHVASPDFWISLPSYFVPQVSLRLAGASILAAAGPNATPSSIQTFMADPDNLSADAVRHLETLGLHYMQPDASDLSAMVEGIVRSIPCLKSLTIRISRQNESDYDFFAVIPRDVIERLFRRLESRTSLTCLTIEMQLRLWTSRKAYADELLETFRASKMRLRLFSPMSVMPASRP
ncbi:hypothetical protein BC831DRAFT_463362 [Entophlyctis helioformis]|nr:hypothetical protein BC831DRAFT_463362 [Entophlyctis helioformis]